MELYSWAEVVKEYNHLHNEEMKKGLSHDEEKKLFAFLTYKMLSRGDGERIGCKFPEDLRFFRSVLSRLKNEAKSLHQRKNKKEIQMKFRFYQKMRIKKIRESSFFIEINPRSVDGSYESLEEQVHCLGLEEDTYF